MFYLVICLILTNCCCRKKIRPEFIFSGQLFVLKMQENWKRIMQSFLIEIMSVVYWDEDYVHCCCCCRRRRCCCCRCCCFLTILSTSNRSVDETFQKEATELSSSVCRFHMWYVRDAVWNFYKSDLRGIKTHSKSNYLELAFSTTEPGRHHTLNTQCI